MKWSEKAWKRIEKLYDTIIHMPFNQELMKGTLPKEKFKFYMTQDAIYLGEFSKALSTISSKMEDTDHMLAFSQFATEAVVVERALHESYFQELGLDTNAKPSPGCLLYTSYILKECAYGNLEYGLAAVLPCFWIYKEVGDYIYENQSENNPYHRWIETYAGEEFAESVSKAIEITDFYAEKAGVEQQERMLDVFEKASQLEWIFWESAYQLEEWPV